jgi:Na+/citrate or Na+/malate symporter
MILGAANRTDLIGISETATRIGGAMTVVIAIVVFGLWAK